MIFSIIMWYKISLYRERNAECMTFFYINVYFFFIKGKTNRCTNGMIWLIYKLQPTFRLTMNVHVKKMKLHIFSVTNSM